MRQANIAFILCICTNLAAVFCNTQEFNGTFSKLLPYTLLLKANVLNSTCGEELQIFQDAVDQGELWGLKILDSSGVFKPGFLYGNNYWLGSRSQCLDSTNTIPIQRNVFSQRKTINDTAYRVSQKEFPPFQINYFVAHFKHNSTHQYRANVFDEDVITLGLCLPASCTTNNLSFILETILFDKISLVDDHYSAHFQLIQVKDLNDNDRRLSGVSYFICISLGFSFLMIAVGTMYDIFVYQKRVKKNDTNETNNSKKNDTNETGNSMKENMSERIERNISMPSHQESKIGRILICYSAYTNTKKIFSMTKLDSGPIPIIHGLKFLSMCWIIIGHSIYYTLDFIDNKIWLWRFIENYGAYIFDIGIVSVDTFFFLSGYLITYMYFQLQKTNEELFKLIDYKKKLIQFFINIIKRFIRLTPAYMIVLGISQLSIAWFDKTSLFYIYEKTHENCAKYWWRNLLYINNLFGRDAICMSWSWYLACDMQFYVIAMMLLILSITYFYTAVTILSALLIGSIIFRSYTLYVYEYASIFDELNRLFDILYLPSWFRISPYIIGMIVGYILIKLNNNLVLKKKINIFCWFLTIVCNIFILYMLYGRDRSILAASIYLMLHKILWTISIAWVVIACSTNHGGIISQLLSFKGWIPLSKLTYSAYLLHPVVIRSICLYKETPIHFEFLSWIIMNVEYITITYFCSYALSLMVEIPYILLMKMFI